MIVMIDLKCLVAYWPSKGHSVTAIHAKLVTWFREKAPAYSSLANWCQCLHFGEGIFKLGIHLGKPSSIFVHFTMLTELTAFTFHSVRTLANTFKIPRSMIWNHFQKGPFVI
jgi:hypothetical protein